MRRTRLYLFLMLFGVSLLGVLLGVAAQERLPSPPPVIPPEDAEELLRPPPDPSKALPLKMLTGPSGAKGPVQPVGGGEPKGPAPVKPADLKNPNDPALPSLPSVVLPSVALPEVAGPLGAPPAAPEPKAAPLPALPEPPLPTAGGPANNPPPALPALPQAPPLDPAPTPVVPAPVVPAPAPKPVVPAPMPVAPAPMPPAPTPPMPSMLPAPVKDGTAPAAQPPEVKPRITIPVGPVPEPAVGQPSIGTPPQSAIPKPPPFTRVKTKQPIVITPAPPTHPEVKEPWQPFGTPPPVAPEPPVVKPLVENSISKSFGPLDVGSVLLSMQTPQLTVEKRGPAVLRQGEPLTFQIVVRNVGAVAAHQVRIEDEIPTDAKIIGGNPQPFTQGTKAIWMLNELQPGGERVLTVALQAGTFSELVNNTSVNVMVATTTRPRASLPGPQPPLAPTPPAPPAPPPAQAPVNGLVVHVTPPAGVLVGQAAVFEVTLSNKSTQPMTGLVLHVDLTAGLRHPAGQSIEAEVGTLDAGASRSVKLSTAAVAKGRQMLEARLTGPGNVETTGQGATDVGEALGTVSVQQTLAGRLFVGRVSDLRIDVTNQSPRTLRNVSVVDYLPEGMEFVSATERGIYQPNNGRAVYWLVEQIEPGKTQSLVLRVQGKAAGQAVNQIVVQGDGVPEAKSSTTLAVEGVADLSLRLLGMNMAELGKEATFDIQVSNPGTSPLTNVRVEVVLSEGLALKSAQGAAYTTFGQRLVFQGPALLPPQSQATLRVTAIGQSDGVRRVRASATSDQVQTPVEREQQTQVYRN